ncbi:MAG: hypothetical protein AUK48_09150 [Oscillatoriales cyanobacterium CG2_30_44_21]|nr:MAG: hypothetical protein AUK48_09150 [Oscillatoriales cyanobacterium CG2_30_44_21]
MVARRSRTTKNRFLILWQVHIISVAALRAAMLMVTSFLRQLPIKRTKKYFESVAKQHSQNISWFGFKRKVF